MPLFSGFFTVLGNLASLLEDRFLSLARSFHSLKDRKDRQEISASLFSMIPLVLSSFARFKLFHSFMLFSYPAVTAFRNLLRAILML